MEEALVAQLLASPEVAALVGTRITWDERPQGGAFPSITLNVIDGSPVYSDEGPAGVTEIRVQIDCWAINSPGKSGSSVAKTVARAVAAALPVYFMRNGVEFQGVFPDLIRDFPPEVGPGEVKFYRRIVDYQLSYTG